MAQDRQIAAYGTWVSPIDGDVVAGDTLRFGLCGAKGGAVYWSETRAAQRGRTVLVCRDADGTVADCLPRDFSARSRVHEYGGGEFAVTPLGLFAVNAADQEIYRIVDKDHARRVTDGAGTRFADICADPGRRRLLCVGEHHGGEGGLARNFIASVALNDTPSQPVRLVSGADFYASPQLSRDGGRLAWLAWDLPHMPWDSAALFVADLDEEGGIGPARKIAGGGDAATFQPEWTADGKLVFVADDSGWGNLMVWDGSETQPLVLREAEFARPLWSLATTSYAILESGAIAASYIEGGRYRLGIIAASGGGLEPVPCALSQIDNVRACGQGVVAIGADDARAPAVVALDLSVPGECAITLIRRGAKSDVPGGMISHPRQMTFPGGEGRDAHGLYYPPVNSRFSAPEAELPPVIVSAHGGPTGMADRGFKPKIQYWTSRGFGYFDVDYAGSFGYGRAYRNALNGRWGIADVEDVVAGARWLAKEGLADPARLLISGGSAGGYTVLCALAFHDVFAAGAAYYGISDLERLAALTHKFESGYIHSLLGVDPDKAEAVYRARSPLFHADRMSAPVIFFQGSDDKVVPPDQSRAMVQSLKERGIAVAYLEFEGEAHGFRQARNIKAALESEYAFYARIFGLDVGEPLPDLVIANMD